MVKKRLKNVGQNLRGHAVAGVRNAQAQELAWPRIRVAAGKSGTYVHQFRMDVELSAGGHGIACIDGQIDEHLPHHSGIGVDLGQSGLGWMKEVKSAVSG